MLVLPCPPSKGSAGLSGLLASLPPHPGPLLLVRAAPDRGRRRARPPARVPVGAADGPPRLRPRAGAQRRWRPAVTRCADSRWTPLDVQTTAGAGTLPEEARRWTA